MRKLLQHPIRTQPTFVQLANNTVTSSDPKWGIDSSPNPIREIYTKSTSPQFLGRVFNNITIMLVCSHVTIGKQNEEMPHVLRGPYTNHLSLT